MSEKKDNFTNFKSAHFRIKKQNSKNVLDTTFKATCK